MSEPFVIGIVGADVSSEAEVGVRQAIVGAVEAAGGTPEVWTEATAIVNAANAFVIVFDAGRAPERLRPIALAIADARTRPIPRVLVVDPRATAAQIAPFEGAVVALSTASPAELERAIVTALEHARALEEAEARARSAGAERDALAEVVERLDKDAGTLSHDARVLFGIILGLAANMRDALDGPVTDTQRTHLVSVVDASNDAAALVERYSAAVKKSVHDVLRGKLARPPRVDRRSRHDVAELVRATVTLFEGMASDRGIHLDTRAELSALAWCDAIALKQALVNLLANALKFTPGGGHVEVSVRLAPSADATASAVRRWIELTVQDSGPGIPAADRARVFDRGTRLDRDRDMPGSGVGLAVVRDVVLAHGAKIRVEDAPGGGALFVIDLPSDLRSRAFEAREPGRSAPGAS